LKSITNLYYGNQEVYLYALPLNSSMTVKAFSNNENFINYFKDADCEIDKFDVSEINIKENPNKEVYIKGEYLDLTGLVVTAQFDDEGEPKQLDITELDISGYKKDTVGTQTITVKYSEKECSFEVTVIEVEGITIEIKPTKTDYVEGEELDLAGLVVTAQFNEGEPKQLGIAELEISGYEKNTVGTQTITVKYNGFEKTFEVTVNEAAPVLTGITLTKEPIKKVYNKGEELDLAGLVVTAQFNEGEPKQLNIADLEISGYEKDTVGTQTITVKYNGFESSFEVTVNEAAPVLTGITLTKEPTKKAYNKGEELDLAGLIVTAQFSKGEPKQLGVADLEISGYKKDAVGTQTITVKYNGFKKTFEVTVNEAVPVLTGITLTKEPTKKVYNKGEELDLAGLIVTAQFSKGEPKQLDLAELQVIGYEKDTVGTQTITVKYKGFESSFEVTVNTSNPGGGTSAEGSTPDKGSDKEEPKQEETTPIIQDENRTVVFRDNIKIGNVEGYMKGYEDNTFRPQNFITRAEIAQALSNIITNNGSIGNFTTDTLSAWYTEAIEKIVSLGIMRGFEDGTFRPNNNITRQDMAITICNMLNLDVSTGTIDVKLNDIDGVYGEASIRKLASLGIINGYEDGTFRPNSYITRAEVKILLNRVLEKILKNETDKEIPLV